MAANRAVSLAWDLRPRVSGRGPFSVIQPYPAWQLANPASSAVPHKDRESSRELPGYDKACKLPPPARPHNACSHLPIVARLDIALGFLRRRPNHIWSFARREGDFSGPDSSNAASQFRAARAPHLATELPGVPQRIERHERCLAGFVYCGSCR